MGRPFLIIIDGPIGSGKTTVSKILHKKLKRTALISLDRLKRLISDFRRGNHDDIQLASDIGVAMTKEYLKQGFNVIVEKAFSRSEYVKDFTKIAKNRNIKLLVYQLEAPLEIRIYRVGERDLPEGVKTKPSKSRILKNAKHHDLYKYKRAKIFDSKKLSPNKIAREILKDLE